jgi:hypothetical protein
LTAQGVPLLAQMPHPHLVRRTAALSRGKHADPLVKILNLTQEISFLVSLCRCQRPESPGRDVVEQSPAQARLPPPPGLSELALRGQGDG